MYHETLEIHLYVCLTKPNRNTCMSMCVCVCGGGVITHNLHCENVYMSDNDIFDCFCFRRQVCKKVLEDLGPVAQSIVSLTSSLRGQLVKCFTTL